MALAAADALLAAPDVTETQRERAEIARLSALRSLKKNDVALPEARALVEKRKSAAAHVELARCLLAGDDEAGGATPTSSPMPSASAT